MGYRIYSPDYKYTAENYQIMNYGFGGSISLHLDASNDVSDNDISEIKDKRSLSLKFQFKVGVY